MATLSTGLWASGGPLAPGDSDFWFQTVPKGRVKWFIAYNDNNPGLVHQLEITRVSTRRLSNGQNEIRVTIKNIGTEHGFTRSSPPRRSRERAILKIFVVHDEAGNIRSFGVPSGPSEGGPVLAPSEGQLVAEVEFSESDASAREPENLERLFAKLKTLRVDRSEKTPRLVPR